jgi:hypothetical protein
VGWQKNHHFHTCAHGGCLVEVNVPINKKCKLRPSTMDYVFLGYASCSIAYRFLVVKSKVSDMYDDTVMDKF